MEEFGIVRIGRFVPSSKICSQCGNVKHDLKFSGRIYPCDVYGLSKDRHLNASINIRNIGLIKVGRGTPEFTPVESATAAGLSKGGLRVDTLRSRNVQPIRAERMSENLNRVIYSRSA
ncbi:MAG: transposase [Candidatus Thermoplasmatota archaeon]|nr:transposase [Candidatus Thermoplasmatota archaeon]